MTKKQKLEDIANKIANCMLCQQHSLGKAVPGEGSPDAKVVFVGEAPGKKEAETGRPFIGRSGKLLREKIKQLGLLERDIFITSVCKYLPITGKPSKEQILHSKKYLLEQIAIIKPRLIVLLGSIAGNALLDTNISVAKQHGTLLEKDGIYYFLTYHPAAAIRFAKNLVYFSDDFSHLKEIVATI